MFASIYIEDSFPHKAADFPDWHLFSLSVPCYGVYFCSQLGVSLESLPSLQEACLAFWTVTSHSQVPRGRWSFTGRALCWLLAWSQDLQDSFRCWLFSYSLAERTRPQSSFLSLSLHEHSPIGKTPCAIEKNNHYHYQ